MKKFIIPIIALLCAACGPNDRHFVLDRTIEVAGRQGVAADENYYYVSSSTALYKYTKDGELVASNETPFTELSLEANHFGDIDVYNGEIFTGIEIFIDGAGVNMQVAVYDAETLAYKYSIPWNENSGQVEVCGLAVDREHNRVWMADWVQGHELYCYDLATREYVGKVTLDPSPRLQQGIYCSKGRMYISCDDGNADADEPDNIYVTDLYDGKNLLEKSQPRVWRKMDDFKRAGEIEGLTFDPATGELIVLSNRGSRIVLGMVRGFYEGYDREIHELYIYK